MANNFNINAGIYAKNGTSSILPSQKSNIMIDKLNSFASVSKIQLQGHTIGAENKYTSLAEVHQRGFIPKNSYKHKFI